MLAIIGKGNEKKATKQTTLFGMAPKAAGDKKAKPKQAKAVSPSEADNHTDEVVKPANISAGTDTEETQEIEAEEETQPMENDNEMEEHTPNGGDDDDEPIEWPESPARETSVS
jgi:hypothetical protein